MRVLLYIIYYLSGLIKNNSCFEPCQINKNQVINSCKFKQDSLPNYDDAVNNTFILRTVKGLKKYLSKKKYKQVNTSFYNNFIFLNSNKKECCEVQTFFFEKAEIRRIFISFCKKRKYKKINYKTSIGHFTTNRLISLGITEKQFLKLSNQVNYSIEDKNGFKTYMLYEKDNEIFGDYSFKNGKLYYINLSIRF